MPAEKRTPATGLVGWLAYGKWDQVANNEALTHAIWAQLTAQSGNGKEKRIRNFEKDTRTKSEAERSICQDLFPLARD